MLLVVIGVSSRELIRRVIEFRDPPRIGLKFRTVGFTDCHDLWARDAAGYTWRSSGNDAWGCFWQRSDADNVGQVTGHPLGEAEALNGYRPPDAHHPSRWADFAEQLSEADERYTMFCLGHGLFERLHLLRGYEPALAGFYTEPETTERVLDLILSFHLGQLEEACARTGDRLDSVAMADDWGVQNGLVISLPTFRRYFASRYERLFGAVKERGLHMWLHSCGKVNEVVDDLIELGLNVINIQQPRITGIDDIGRRFAGRICFETILDVQSTFPLGTAEDIRTEARELVDKWGTEHGGLIASDYEDAAAIGTTLERRRWAFEAFARFGGADPAQLLAGGKPAAVA